MDSEERPVTAETARSTAGIGRFGGTGTAPSASLSEQLNALQATIAANRPALNMQNDTLSSRSVSPRFPGLGVSPSSPVAGADTSRADSPLTPGHRPSPFSSTGAGRSLTPLLSRSATMQASSSSTALVGTGGKSSDSSSSLLNIMRRELEQAEQRLEVKIKKVSDSSTSSLMKSDKLREVALTRLDQKVGNCELAQSKLDRKISEISGTVRGLSDEAQQHIRRADTQDNRLYEFKHQMEEDFKQKMSELTLQYQEMVSRCRSTWSASEDAQKRYSQHVRRLDAQLQEHGSHTQDHGLKLEDLQARVDAIEEGYQQEAANTKAACEELVAVRRPSFTTSHDPSATWKYEQQLNDIEQKVERLFNEAHGDDSYDSKLHEFEVRLTGVRSKIDNQETFCSTVEGKLKKEFEQRIDGLRKKMEELCGKQLDVQELLEKQIRGVQATDEALEELRSASQLGRGRKMDLSEISSDPQADGPARSLAGSGLRVDSLQQDVAAMMSEVQLLHGKFAEIDHLIASKVTKEKLDGMEQQRRLLKVEHELQSLFERTESRNFTERNAPSEFAEKTKSAEEKLSVVRHELMEEARQNTASMAERMQHSEQALNELRDKLQAIQASGTGTQVSAHAASAINELRNEVQVIKQKEEHLMRQTATLKDLAEKLSEVQKDTARHCRWALAEPKELEKQELEKGNVILQQQLEALGGENTAHRQRIESLTSQLQQAEGQNSIPVIAEAQAHGSDALAKMNSLEVRVGTAEDQLRDIRQEIAALTNGQAIKVSESQNLRTELTTMINRKIDTENGSGFAGANNSAYAVVPLLNEADGEIVAQELDGLFQRVEEGEMECVKLQDQLKGRIAHMDKLLDKVAKEVLGPEGAAVANAVATAAGAVESISRLLPMGLRLCVLGGKEFQNIENRQLVEAVARQVGSALLGSIVVLTTGKKGVQETFVTNLGSALQVVNLVSETEASGFGVGTDLAAGDTLEERKYVLGQLGDVYLTVEGGPVVAEEAKAAAQRRAAVIPLKSTGGASAGMFDFPPDALRKPSWATQEQWDKLGSKAPPDEMAATVVAMLQAILRERGTNLTGAVLAG